jgi:hypothetical protein
LFKRRELDHGPAGFGITKSCEDLAADAEVGMVHVGLLGGFWEAEGQAAKVIGGHEIGFLERAMKARERGGRKGLTGG